MAQAISQPVPRTAGLSSLIDRHLPTRDQLGRSEAIWLVLVAYIVAAKILSDTLVSITFRSPGQQDLFTWSGVSIYAALGLVGIWCARALQFPAAWDRRVSITRRLWLPIAIGLGIGVLEIGMDLLTGGSQALTRVTGQPSFNIDFPGSLLAYSAGAIEVETQYRLFTWPFLVWLISSVALRGRGRRPSLWVVGALAAGFEPVTQGVFLFVAGAGVLTPLMLAGYMLTALPENILAVVFLVAMVSWRQSSCAWRSIWSGTSSMATFSTAWCSLVEPCGCLRRARLTGPVDQQSGRGAPAGDAWRR